MLSFAEKCDCCGRFVNIGSAGVSWSQAWQYGFGGCPELNDIRFRCAPCTDKNGVGESNCTPPEHYRGMNPKEVLS